MFPNQRDGLRGHQRMGIINTLFGFVANYYHLPGNVPKSTVEKYTRGNFGRSTAIDRVPEQLNVAFHWHILAIENKRLPGCMVQVGGKLWTISRGFAVIIETAGTMASAVLGT
jgi:hypothetical protein